MAEAVSSSTDLKEIASLIYKRCIDDREFGKSGACLCDRLANIDAEGTKFRNVMLSLVQVDYKGNGVLSGVQICDSPRYWTLNS